MLGIVLILIVSAIVYLQKPVKNVERVTTVAPAEAQPAETQSAGETQTATQTCVPKAAPPKSSPLAPELAGIAGYVNTKPFTLSELVGKKVILIDVWTYSCINCQRTLPYITAWYSKYKYQGLEIVGVHSPEFDFEKKLENVQRAVEKFNIKYPVVLDNDHATWDAWSNRYWPAKYLIDIDGRVVWHHFGEGEYDVAEAKIRELLMERKERLCIEDGMPTDMAKVKAEEVNFLRINTPEIYLGYAFSRGNFGNKEGLPAEQFVQYALPSNTKENEVYLQGEWYVDKDNVRLMSESGKIVLKYDAKNVNIVASSPGSDITVLVDSVEAGKVRVEPEDLYTVVSGKDYGEHLVTLDIAGTGFRLYTFTFG